MVLLFPLSLSDCVSGTESLFLAFLVTLAVGYFQNPSCQSAGGEKSILRHREGAKHDIIPQYLIALKDLALKISPLATKV